MAEADDAAAHVAAGRVPEAKAASVTDGAAIGIAIDPPAGGAVAVDPAGHEEGSAGNGEVERGEEGETVEAQPAANAIDTSRTTTVRAMGSVSSTRPANEVGRRAAFSLGKLYSRCYRPGARSRPTPPVLGDVRRNPPERCRTRLPNPDAPIGDPIIRSTGASLAVPGRTLREGHSWNGQCEWRLGHAVGLLGCRNCGIRRGGRRRRSRRGWRRSGPSPAPCLPASPWPPAAPSPPRWGSWSGSTSGCVPLPAPGS